jgi:hypothetical protein
MRKLFLHLPAYREPELIPTIKDALENAEFPERLVFGICRQFNPEDAFDNVDEFRKDKRFKIYDLNYLKAKGLPYARAIINDELLEDEEFVLQLDSHHRFTKNWDSTLIGWYDDLKEEGYNPLIGGYSPLYSPFNDPEGRVQEPWFSDAACFYPHGTLFIRPAPMENWQSLTKPIPGRFLSGHFSFGPNKWAKEVKHDPDIYFSGEEINLTVRSFTHGYDLFHPHRVVVWHATMREERDNMLIWDDQNRRGDDMWWRQQDIGRAKIRQLLQVEDNGFDLTGYDVGTVRTIKEYEKYAGVHFKKRGIQQYTADRKFAPNPVIEDEQEWENSFLPSTYHLVNITKDAFPRDNYTGILVAYDDEQGKAIHSYVISDERLEKLMTEGQAIHYEDFFLTDKRPDKVVIWAHNESDWLERTERKL